MVSPDGMSCARATYVISVADVAFILTTKSEEDLDERVGLLTSACGDRLANYMGGGPAQAPTPRVHLSRASGERASENEKGRMGRTNTANNDPTDDREREREREREHDERKRCDRDRDRPTTVRREEGSE